jgi:hypothetical protein
MGRGATGSGRFRVSEQVWWGGGIREVCPVTVRLLCTVRLSRLFLSMCNRGFQDLLSVRSSSLFMLNGCISISMAALMRRSMHLVLTERSLVSCSLMVKNYIIEN